MKKLILNAIIIITSLGGYSQVLVKNLAPGLQDGNPQYFYKFDQNRIVFFAWDGSTALGAGSSFPNGLYITDGTSSGTLELKNFAPYVSYPQGLSLTNVASSYGFTKIDSLGYIIRTIGPNGLLIRTNGLINGTTTYTFSAPTSTVATPECRTRFFKLGTNICWIYRSTTFILYKYNILTNQISSVNIPSYYFFNSSLGSGYNYGILMHRSYYNSYSGNVNDIVYPPFSYDGNNEPVIEDVVTSGNYFYFYKTGWGTYQDSLFKVDTFGARQAVTTTTAGLISNYGVVINDKYLFPGNNPSIGMEPYYLNLLNNSFGVLKDINPYFNYSSDPKFILLPLDKKGYNHTRIYFTAEHADYGREIWTTDGTTAGTYMVQDFKPGPLSSDLYSNGSATFNNGKYTYTSYIGDSLITSTNIIDTVRLVTPNTIVSYSSTAPIISTAPTTLYSSYIWRNGVNAYLISNWGGIYKVGSSSSPTASLSPLNCGGQYLTPNAIMEINGCLILNQKDCSFTGYELYKYCNNSLYNSINEIATLQNHVSVFPNPSTSQFNFNGLVGENIIQITDITGRGLLMEKTFTENHTLKLDAAQGIYFYKITDKANRVQQGKIILQ
jgi:ELWxxDGT repeat protein